jgi:hypothetical protein
LVVSGVAVPPLGLTLIVVVVASTAAPVRSLTAAESLI